MLAGLAPLPVAYETLLLQPDAGGPPAYHPTGVALARITGGIRITWTDNAPDNTDYSIERRNATAGGAFAEVGTTGNGDAETHDDVDTFVQGDRYEYRVVVVGGAGDGQASAAISIVPVPDDDDRRRVIAASDD